MVSIRNDIVDALDRKVVAIREACNYMDAPLTLFEEKDRLEKRLHSALRWSADRMFAPPPITETLAPQEHLVEGENVVWIKPTE